MDAQGGENTHKPTFKPTYSRKRGFLMSKLTKIVKESFGNPDKEGYFSGAYIFCDGTAEFVCGYQAPSGKSNGSEEYYNVMPATPQQVYAKYETEKPQTMA